MDILRRKVDVDIKSSRLLWKKRGVPGILAAQKKIILDEITFSCPSNQITAIIVGHIPQIYSRSNRP